jgi:hypothetical protein
MDVVNHSSKGEFVKARTARPSSTFRNILSAAIYEPICATIGKRKSSEE